MKKPTLFVIALAVFLGGYTIGKNHAAKPEPVDVRYWFNLGSMASLKLIESSLHYTFTTNAGDICAPAWALYQEATNQATRGLQATNTWVHK